MAQNSKDTNDAIDFLKSSFPPHTPATQFPVP